MEDNIITELVNGKESWEDQGEDGEVYGGSKFVISLRLLVGFCIVTAIFNTYIIFWKTNFGP
jgi:hypothetical protein